MSLIFLKPREYKTYYTEHCKAHSYCITLIAHSIMKFAVSLAVLALAVAVFAADPAPPAAFTCTGKDVTGKTHYKDPLSGKGWSGNYACMKYHECTGGKDNVHECFWFIPLRQYDPKTRGCAFFWHAKCSDPDPK